MTKTTADRTAIADRAIGNAAGDVGKRFQTITRKASVLNIGGGDASADRNGIAIILDSSEFRNASDVNEQSRLRKPEIKHRPQRLGACNHSVAAIACIQ